MATPDFRMSAIEYQCSVPVFFSMPASQLT